MRKISIVRKRRSKKAPAIPARAAQKRALKTPKYKTLRLSKRIKHPATRLPKARLLFKQSILTLWQHKRVFAGIMAIFGVLYVIFVRGFAGSDLASLKETLQESEGFAEIQAAQGLGMVAYLFGNVSTADSEIASTYQLLLLALVSMALIWTFRQLHSDTPRPVSIKNAYYNGTAPFVRYLLVNTVIVLQLVPALLGLAIYQQVLGTGLAASSAESFVWLMLLIMMLLLSFYMVSSSIFALFIVTLPDVTPMQALRSARELVHFRRFEVIRKVIFAPFVLVCIIAVLFIPITLFLTSAADVLFFVAAVLAIAIMNSYLYQLYRSLL